MYVYSTTINIFRKRIKALAQKILATEMNLKLSAQGRLNWKDQYYIPLNFAVFQQEGRTLGYYDASTYTVALNICWMTRASDQVLLNVLRHELAHMAYTTEQWLAHGKKSWVTVGEHDEHFKKFCDQFWPGQEIGNASLEMDDTLAPNQAVPDESKILSKIKKLWALAESSNVHEAALAAAKANELLLRHHLASLQDLALAPEDLTYQKIIYHPQVARAGAKMDAIGAILKLFFVAVVQTRQDRYQVLAAVGTYENLQIAEYVAAFLDHELDRLWALSPYRGNRARNSFFAGVAAGFTSKIKETQKAVAASKELMCIEDDLQARLRQVYPSLARRTSARRFDHAAHAAGHQAGKNLSITAALNKPSTPSHRLLT